ncbi:MAG: hypothetical protein AAGH57_01860 [Pseudomonadota bacterium]
MNEDRTLGDAIESQWLGQNGISTGTWANSVGLSEYNSQNANTSSSFYGGYSGGGNGSIGTSLSVLAALGFGGYALVQTGDWATAGIFAAIVLVAGLVFFAVLKWFFGTTLGRIILWPFVALLKALRFAILLAALAGMGYFGLALFGAI